MNLFAKAGMAAVLAVCVFAGAAQSAPTRSDGIHTQDWMKSDSFLDLKEDLTEALDAGRDLVIIFEQPGCGACKRLHEVNFVEPDLVKTITDNFDVLQINMYGNVTVTDFDGEELSEGDFAIKHRVNFTPTTMFIGEDGKEIFRLPGYFKPYYYKSGFEFVMDGAPQEGQVFPRWLKAKRNRGTTE